MLRAVRSCWCLSWICCRSMPCGGRSSSTLERLRKVLLQQLAVPDCPRKHWSTTVGWIIAESMATVLSYHTKRTIAKVQYYSLSTDEVTTNDHESWLSVHIMLSLV